MWYKIGDHYINTNQIVAIAKRIEFSDNSNRIILETGKNTHVYYERLHSEEYAAAHALYQHIESGELGLLVLNNDKKHVINGD